MQINPKILDFKLGSAFLAIALVYILIGVVNNNFIFTETYYFNSLGSRLDSDRIHEIFTVNAKYQWITYLIQPAFLLLKLSAISAVLYTGVILNNDTVEYKIILKVTILAETIMALAALVKMVWMLVTGFDSIAAVSAFHPLSIVNVLNMSRIPSYLMYPLQQLNLFELCYWLFIAFGLKMLLNKSYGRSMSIVASSYGVSFLIWIITVVFLQIQFS